MEAEQIITGASRTLFDAIPIVVLIVDGDGRIRDLNRTAREELGGDDAATLRLRGGEALNCLNARETPEGCGHGSHCPQCPIRNAVREAFGGQPVSRRRAKVQLERRGGIRETEILITASLLGIEGRDFALLLIEDVTELSLLKNIIPICQHCRQIRDDNDYWSSVEIYFKNYLGVMFSHGICPKCMRTLYPDVLARSEHTGDHGYRADSPDERE